MGCNKRVLALIPKWAHKIWQYENNPPCPERIASDVLSMGPWAKGRPSSVDLGYEEGLHLIWGPLAGLSKNGTGAKWAHEISPNIPIYGIYPLTGFIYPTYWPRTKVCLYSNVTMVLYLACRCLGWKRLHFRKSIFGMQGKYDANICMKTIYVHSGEGK